MNSGLKLTTYFIGLSLLWSSSSYARNQIEAAHNPAITKNEPLKTSLNTTQDPFTIFKTQLLPFMQKNCSECHGDNAIYPVGPKHSASEPKMAFEVFTKLTDPSDYKNSRFIKVASNKHYCSDHNYNCDNQELVNAELNRLFINYVGAVTALPKADANTNSIENANLSANRIHTTNPMALNQKSSQGEPSQFKINPSEPTTHKEQLQVDKVALTMTTKVRVYRPDFVKVVHISLSTAQKIDLTFDGIEIKINGHLPTKATGFESMSRDLSFDGLGMMTTKLTLTREVILKAKPGDEVTIKLLGLRSKDLSPLVKACKDQTYAQKSLDFTQPYLPLISSMVYGHEGYGNLNRNQIEESSKRSPKQRFFLEFVGKMWIS